MNEPKNLKKNLTVKFMLKNYTSKIIHHKLRKQKWEPLEN